MKKINNSNKFRGNAVYSLNYKFDSVSPAGKCSGTALDLIKRYNELAKEAQNNGDYVGMEVFRQYAEHYRKIVTEINERKYQPRENQNVNNTSTEPVENAEQTSVADNGLVETEKAEISTPLNEQKPEISVETSTDSAIQQPPAKIRRRRNFTVVEVSEPEKNTVMPEPHSAAETPKPHRRSYTCKAKPAETAAEA